MDSKKIKIHQILISELNDRANHCCTESGNISRTHGPVSWQETVTLFYLFFNLIWSTKNLEFIAYYVQSID